MPLRRPPRMKRPLDGEPGSAGREAVTCAAARCLAAASPAHPPRRPETAVRGRSAGGRQFPPVAGTHSWVWVGGDERCGVRAAWGRARRAQGLKFSECNGHLRLVVVVLVDVRPRGVELLGEVLVRMSLRVRRIWRELAGRAGSYVATRGFTWMESALAMERTLKRKGRPSPSTQLSGFACASQGRQWRASGGRCGKDNCALHRPP